MRHAAVMFTVLWTAMASIAVAFEAPQPRTKLVDGPMAKLTPILGAWEIDAEWTDGSPLWARNEYRIGLGGKFVVANTYAKNSAGGIYHRYMTMFGYDAKDDTYYSWGFVYDGTMKRVPIQVDVGDGKLTLTSEWEASPGAMMRQKVTVAAKDHYEWQVWQQRDGDWSEIMNGQWKQATD